MERAGEILKNFLSRTQMDKAEEFTAFFNGWREVAGERIAAHSVLRELERGKVIIEADHPGWIQIIQMNQQRILDQMRKKFPEIGITGMKIILKIEKERNRNIQPHTAIDINQKRTEDIKKGEGQ
ncbi:MAG: DUF721 domain-containing protein, partial [Spirochaetota bacterium]